MSESANRGKGRYLAFAAWRSADRSSRSSTLRYFHLSTNHSIIWSLVMIGYYSGRPPGMKECITRTPCSPVTARKIIAGAKGRGLFVTAFAPGDRRRQLLHPTAKCIAEFEAMVDNYCAFVPTIAG